MSLLLYEYCVESEYLKRREDFFYDRILFKFILYSAFSDTQLLPKSSTSINNEQNVEKKVEVNNSRQFIIDELVELIQHELFGDSKETNANVGDKGSVSNLGSSVTSTVEGTSLSSSNSEYVTLKLNNYESPTTIHQPELSTLTVEFLKNLLIAHPAKVKGLLELIFKYNANSQHAFLRVHLQAINTLLDDIEAHFSDSGRVDELKSKLLTVLNYLGIYKIDTTTQQLNTPQQPQMQSRIENVRYESLALLQRCFKDLCYKFNSLWPESFEILEENFRQVYSCFLFEKDDTGETRSGSVSSNSLPESDPKTSLLNLFTKIHYEVDRQISISNTFNDDSLPILSLIKQYSACGASRDAFLWRRLFLFCYIENKILLKSIIVSACNVF